MSEFGINDLPDEEKINESENYVLGGKSLRALISVARQMWRGDNLDVGNLGGGLNKRENGNSGFSLRTQSQASTFSTQSNPFQVSMRVNPANPELFQASVSWNSSLSKSIIANDRQVITGLANPPISFGGDGNPNWFNLDADDFIWLEILLDYTNPGTLTSATIASYGLASSPTWTPGANPGLADGPIVYFTEFDSSSNLLFFQTNARIPIAYSLASGTGQPVIYQQLSTNLLMRAEFYSGATDNGTTNIIPIYYPSPWNAPYVTP